jgi:hypothetical protein
MTAPRPLTVQDLIARAEISDVVNRYATGIDRRNWPLYRSCFADQVEMDFTSWSGGEPRRISGDEWVAGVRQTLSAFDATQHVSTNHVHEIDGDEATCVSYMMALHYLAEGPAPDQRRMHGIGGFYTNRLRRSPDGWRIHACKLTVTWEMGDRSLFQIAQARAQARQDG